MSFPHSLTALCARLAAVAFCATLAVQTGAAQSITTDKEDYAPGETALISGAGFHANEVVTLQIVHTAAGTPCSCPCGADHAPFTVNSDANGELSTTWYVNPNDSLGAVFLLTADCPDGLHAEYIFTDGLGTGRISNVVGLAGACTQLTTIGVGPNAEQFWEVERNKSYIVTLSNVTECTGSTIEVVIHSGNIGDLCLTATQTAPSTYGFVLAMPADACRTFTVTYCTSGCDLTTGKLARQPNGTNQFLGHLRAVRYGPGCTNPVLIGEFECCPDLQLPSPGDVNTCNDPGQCCAVVNFTLSPVDGCPPITVTATPASGTCFPIGTTQVTATATDVNGFSVQTTFNVTVSDCEPPVLTCPPQVTACNDQGQCCGTVDLASLVSATDNCGVHLDIVPPSGTCFAIGTTPVSVTATDDAGNSVQCNFDVTVNDCEDPTITCPPDMAVCNDPDQCSAVVNYTAPASDNCPGVTTVCVPPPGSIFPVGTTPVTCTATDAAGHTAQCTFNVTVNDCQAPVITCPPDVVTCNEPGFCGAEVNYVTPASDNCPGVVVDSQPPSGSLFPVGTTLVTATATDAAGLQTVCTFHVTVNDCESPLITCPGDMNVCNDPGQCSAIVSFATPATDNCPGVSVLVQPPSGSSFPKGTTLVTATATDGAGHVAQCTFHVTVNDCENPTLNCPNALTVCTDPNQCQAVVNFNVTGNDNCPGVTVVVVPPSGSTFQKGTTLVTATATDTAGHAAQCSFNVTVNDCQPPSVSCPGDITVGAPLEFCDRIVTYSASGTDNCPGVNVVLNPPSGSSFHVGTTVVTATATDSSGLTNQCQFNVIVYAGAISGYVFYDLNTNGVQDPGEQGISHWKVTLGGGPSAPQTVVTSALGHYVFNNLLPGVYTVTQIPPPQGNWQNTTPVQRAIDTYVTCPGTSNFGVVCLGAGGGLSLNFWQGTTGKTVLQQNDPAWRTTVNTYCLRDLGGCIYSVPTGAFLPAYNSYKNWLRNNSTANAAYKLSALASILKLSSMGLTGLSPGNGVNPNAWIFARNTASANAGGFAQVSAILAEAKTQLCAHGCTPGCANASYVPVCGPVECQFRVAQQAIMAACDGANNNSGFVLPQPCKFTWGY
jgi:hypothetical protein